MRESAVVLLWGVSPHASRVREKNNPDLSIGIVKSGYEFFFFHAA